MAAVARVFRGSLFLMSPAAGAKAAGTAAVAKAASTELRAPTGISDVGRVFRGSLYLMSPAKAAGTAAVAKAAGKAVVAKAAGAAAAKKKTKEASTKPRAATGIMKPIRVSDELSRFAGGAPEIARSQAMKLVWAHVKAHGLQDPAKKTEINCDATLKSLFGGRDRIGMLEIMKLLRPHFLEN